MILCKYFLISLIKIIYKITDANHFLDAFLRVLTGAGAVSSCSLLSPELSFFDLGFFLYFFFFKTSSSVSSSLSVESRLLRLSTKATCFLGAFFSASGSFLAFWIRYFLLEELSTGISLAFPLSSPSSRILRYFS